VPVTLSTVTRAAAVTIIMMMVVVLVPCQCLSGFNLAFKLAISPGPPAAPAGPANHGDRHGHVASGPERPSLSSSFTPAAVCAGRPWAGAPIPNGAPARRYASHGLRARPLPGR
jgi:hypothetical protein